MNISPVLILLQHSVFFSLLAFTFIWRLATVGSHNTLCSQWGLKHNHGYNIWKICHHFVNDKLRNWELLIIGDGRGLNTFAQIAAWHWPNRILIDSLPSHPKGSNSKSRARPHYCSRSYGLKATERIWLMSKRQHYHVPSEVIIIMESFPSH